MLSYAFIQLKNKHYRLYSIYFLLQMFFGNREKYVYFSAIKYLSFICIFCFALVQATYKIFTSSNSFSNFSSFWFHDNLSISFKVSFISSKSSNKTTFSHSNHFDLCAEETA